MAFSDWQTLTSGGAGMSFVGGDDGSSVIHASLANPLSLQGTYARAYEVLDVNNDAKSNLYLLDSIAHPDFSSTPDTKAVSLRAWVRVGPLVGNNVNAAVALCAKSNATNTSDLCNGYVLQFGNGLMSDEVGGVDPHVFLTLQFRGTNAGSLGREINLSSQNFVKDTWYHLRMDVIPTLNGAVVDRDTVRIYRDVGTEASPNWSLIHEEIITSGNAGWVDWGIAQTRFGYFIELQQNVADHCRIAYIDSFQALLKDRP